MAYKTKCRPYYDEEEGVWRVAWFNWRDEPTDKLPGRYTSKAEALRVAGTMNRTFDVISF